MLKCSIKSGQLLITFWSGISKLQQPVATNFIWKNHVQIKPQTRYKGLNLRETQSWNELGIESSCTVFGSCLLHYTTRTFSMTPLSPTSLLVNTNPLAWNLNIQQIKGDKTDLKLNICCRITQVPPECYGLILL